MLRLGFRNDVIRSMSMHVVIKNGFEVLNVYGKKHSLYRQTLQKVTMKDLLNYKFQV